ncbi:hypothetical protein PGTUg99_000142 [Puccinia graminis f. sp. tritici]|uniref:Uncharacterized protein n=1 Tax=Puccinia graminis f. sp. tritici TaxID=56615 RepID=A0A5B0RBF7_PUCGR|nr:hypothetical protein PGTUg99_000142 [Puccinia graminis f. sp. tritici]
MLHLIRTLFSLNLVLAFTVAAYPSQSALLQSGSIYILDLTANDPIKIEPSKTCLMVWEKDFRRSTPKHLPHGHGSRRPETLFKKLLNMTAERAEKRSSQPIPRSFSRIRRRPEAGIATSRQTTGISNPRPWVQKDEAI